MTASSSREPTVEDYEYLGRMVYEARQILGLSQREVASNGGPSDTIQTAIEAGEWRLTPKSSPTLAKLDAGLSWGQGVARQVLFDRVDPLPSVAANPNASPAPTLGDLSVAISLVRRHETELEKLTGRVQELEEKLARMQSGTVEDDDPPLGLRASEEVIEYLEADSHEQWAARRGQSVGQAKRRDQDQAGEASQDDGGMDPA